MKRPWQIWLLFGLGLAVVVPAMAWLTVKALELDRAESLARQQAELEEDVSRALWRMDTLLTPLLAQEAARPDFVYRPVYATEEAPAGKGKSSGPAQSLSPLLSSPPEFVLLHFAVHPDGCVTSPQCPIGTENTWALGNGIGADYLASAASRLELIKPALLHADLLAQLPALPAPGTDVTGAIALNPGPGYGTQNTIISNSYEGLNQQPTQQAVIPLPSPLNPDASFLPNPEPPQVAANLAGQQAPNQADDFSDVQSQGDYGAPRQSQQKGGQQLAFNQNVESGRSQRAQTRDGNDLPNRG